MTDWPGALPALGLESLRGAKAGERPWMTYSMASAVPRPEANNDPHMPGWVITLSTHIEKKLTRF